MNQCERETTNSDQAHCGTHICRKRKPHAGLCSCAVCGFKWVPNLAAELRASLIAAKEARR